MTTPDERTAASQRFFTAVHEAMRGDYSLCRAMVEAVRAKYGSAAAAAQRRELWRVIQSGNKGRSK